MSPSRPHPQHAVTTFNPALHRHLLPFLVDIHVACVELDNTSATFLPPLDRAAILSFYVGHADQCALGHEDIFMLFSPRGPAAPYPDLPSGVPLRSTHPDPGPGAEPPSDAAERAAVDAALGLERIPAGHELAGYFIATYPTSETGPMRSGVRKLLTSPNHRRKGVASALLGRGEEVAWRRGRVVLDVSTDEDSAGPALYEKLGYVKLGTIPDYAVVPDGTRRNVRAEVFYYKDLQKTHLPLFDRPENCGTNWADLPEHR